MNHDNSTLTHHVTVRSKSVLESAQVNPVDAFVLRQFYVKGREVPEIATLSGMSRGSIYVRLHRLRKRIPALSDL